MKYSAFVFAVLSLPLFAQTPPSTPAPTPPFAPELAPLAARHKSDLALVEAQKKAALARAQHDYLATLDFAEKSAGLSGNIKGIAAIGKERELASTKSDLALNFPADLPEALRPGRKVYLDAIGAVNAEVRKREDKIDSDYLSTLTLLASKGAANPVLAQQIASEKAELIRRATTPEPSTAAAPEKPAAPATGGQPAASPVAALASKLVNGNFEEADADGLPAGWKLVGSLAKGKVLPDGVSFQATKENGLSFLRMTFDGRFTNCAIAQELAVPNRARTVTIKVRYRGKVTGRFDPKDRRCWPDNDLSFYNEKGEEIGHGFTNLENMLLKSGSTVATHNQATFKSWEATIPVTSGAVKAKFKLESGKCTGVFDWEHAEVEFK